MARGFKPLTEKIAGEAWLIVLATLSAIFLAVIAVGRDAGRPAHEAVMLNLRAVDVNHASLQRDVLRARAGLLMSYDPLVNSVVALRKTAATLHELFANSYFGPRGELEALLSELQAAIDADETLVERFKTRNALLQNSIGVFGQTLTELHQSPDDGVKSVLDEVSDLGNLMMRFSTRPDLDLKRAIGIRLARLDQSIPVLPVGKDIQTLTAHARMILSILPTVDAKVASMQASATPLRAERLQAKYLEVAGEANARAAASRMLLAVTAIALCLYVFVLVYRLRNQTERLKRRLQYEQVIAESKAEMFNTAPRDFAEFMNGALNRMTSFFTGDSCSLAMVNLDSEEIKQVYGLAEEDEENRTLIIDFIRDVRAKDPPPAPHDRSPYVSLLRPNELTYTRDATILGLVVGSPMPDRQMAALLLLFDLPRPELGTDEITFLQGCLQTLIEFVETNNSQREREALEHRLEHAQRLEAVGTLAGGIAHEFNNVLGAILGYGEMALQLLRKPSMTRNYVQEILISGERAKHIVDQILTFSRKRERAIRPFSVTEAVADILPLIEVTLGSKVTLMAHLSQQPAVVEGNPIEIHQIIMNLCKNAMEASSRGQEVVVEVKTIEVRRRRTLSHGEISPGTYVYLSVEDYGPGIAEHVLPHVFEPFFTTKSTVGGTGLGLSAVHGSVTSLGGSINVQSAAGSGTRFELYFPASSLPPLPIKSFFDQRAVPTGNGERVVILNNDRSLLEMYEEKVAALGYEALGYQNIRTLKEAIHGNGTSPDLMIIDADSLSLDGPPHSLAASLSAGRYLVLVEDDRKQCVANPEITASFLKKPFSSRALANAIFDLMNTAR